MDGPFVILLVALAASVPAMLAHELARATAALVLTRGRVCVLLGAGRPLLAVRLGRLLIGPTADWLWGGECLHAPTVSRRRATAILLAGPLAGDLCFLAAAISALSWRDAAVDHPGAQLALWVFGLVALTRASADLVRLRGRGGPGPTFAPR
jgi:hypothetical protein